MSGSVFLGLVTHAGTRFTESGTERGLVRSLALALDARGVPTTVVIHSEDRADEAGVALDRAAVRASIDEEMAVEGRWRKRLSPSTPGLAIDAFMSARATYRRLRYAPPWAGRLDPQDPGPRMVRRLANIELAHLSLLRQALDSGASWALIVEDDATCDDVHALADDLADFMSQHEQTSQPLYVNISRSFSEDRLHSAAHGSVVGQWGAGDAPRLISYERAVTNTVCAVLYRGTFLTTLVPRMEDIPLLPVIPIDWKLNLALMELEEDDLLHAGDCWSVDPAPIVQGSMTQIGSRP